MRVVFAPSLGMAQEFCTANTVDMTVEAEYGSHVVEGQTFTAAHHQKEGKYQGDHCGGSQPSPCANHQIPLLPWNATILVSHLDLDTLGGILRCQNKWRYLFAEKYSDFWKAAAYVDVHGPHRCREVASAYTEVQLATIWAALGKLHFERDRVTDITEEVMRLVDVLDAALGEIGLHEGKAYLEARKQKSRDTLVTIVGRVLVRASPDFVSDLYEYNGKLYDMVVRLGADSNRLGGITISQARPLGFSCREFMQAKFGKEAGGHDGIAGTPREGLYSLRTAIEVAEELSRMLDNWI